MLSYVTRSADETMQVANDFCRRLSPNSVVCFFGDLGSGKTTFIKGLAAQLIPDLDAQVSSPTFTYLNIYRGITNLYHFDLYRLRDADEFLAMGFDEMFFAEGICCIEWSEKIATLLPAEAIEINMIHLDETSRRIEIKMPEGK